MSRRLAEFSNGISEDATSRGRDQQAGVRQNHERLMSRAAYLSPNDRALIHSAYRAGMTPMDIARLAGMAPVTVRRRLRRLVRHVNSELFTFVMTHRGEWEPNRRRVAEHRFLQCRSLRDTSEHTGLKMHHVRRESSAVMAQFEALHS